MKQRRLVYFTIPILSSLLATFVAHSFISKTRYQRNEFIIPPDRHNQHNLEDRALEEHQAAAERLPRLLVHDTGTSNVMHQECTSDERESRLLGARDENGCPGYIHDTTFVRLHPANFTFSPADVSEGICDKLWGDGPEGLRGMRGLRKIRVVPPSAHPSVLCIVYTHSNRHNILRAIVETYGQRCDGFLAASNETDQMIGAVDIPHLGNESYRSMWPKVRSIWEYVHDHYLDQYSWFHIGGDDMFVVAENLKNAVKGFSIDDSPVYLGGAMIRYPKVGQIMCGGGAGYTLNRAALRVLVEQQFSKPYCKPNDIRPDEDVMISDCLRPIVSCTHSTDELDETRYHPLNANYHAMWEFPGPANGMPDKLMKRHNISSPMKPLLESISATTVSFHLVLQTNFTKYNTPKTVFADKGMRRYHAILFNLCGNETRAQQKKRRRKAQSK